MKCSIAVRLRQVCVNLNEFLCPLQFHLRSSYPNERHGLSIDHLVEHMHYKTDLCPNPHEYDHCAIFIIDNLNL